MTLSDASQGISNSLQNKQQSEQKNKQANFILDFHCQSLRALTVEYQLIRDNNIILSGKLAASQGSTEQQPSLSMIKPAGNYQLKLINFNGLEGFQAIKPGCRLIVNTDKTASVQLTAR